MDMHTDHTPFPPELLNLIPAVKSLTPEKGFFSPRALRYPTRNLDPRLLLALEQLPYDPLGPELELCIGTGTQEEYTLSVRPDRICITAPGPAGGFYGIQTLRQLLRQERLPCLQISDKPDFPYRGFYHDVTRGKLPTLQTLKELVDQMAAYKLNSLQLYVEHTFEFQECLGLHPSTGCYTRQELQELDAYCKDRFIELIPSLSTFGHLFELLNQPQYQHLRVFKDPTDPIVWHARMRHHTIDPLEPESFEVIRSLIDQFLPCFSSSRFNICCDETFDLREYEKQGKDPGALYVRFVQKLLDHIRAQGKQVMMWADILLKYPETLAQIPDDVCFLNWNYKAAPPEEGVAALAQTGKAQILCPGTSTWNRFCEAVDTEEQNISRMAHYARKYGALGILNTNWGDWGNPCALELSLYGMVLGAEKAWSEATPIDALFYRRVNALLYEEEEGMAYLKELSALQDQVSWTSFVRNVYQKRNALPAPFRQAVLLPPEALQLRCHRFLDRLSARQWKQDAFRQEMLLAAQGICLIAEENARLLGQPCPATIAPKQWKQRYTDRWLAKNKPQELSRILELFPDGS